MAPRWPAHQVSLGTKLVVTGPKGEVQRRPPKILGKSVRQALQPDVPAGAYRVDWRVSSDDGHPISGRLSFTVKAAAPSTPSWAGSAAKVRAPSAPLCQRNQSEPGVPATPQATDGGSPLPWIGIIDW
jgi:hypothetical protein